MLTKAKQPEQTTTWYEIPYPASAYTFPQEALIHGVRLDQNHIHLELVDGRILSIPLWWLPAVHNATPEDRECYEISRDRKAVIWDPDKGVINDELHIDHYLTVQQK